MQDVRGRVRSPLFPSRCPRLVRLRSSQCQSFISGFTKILAYLGNYTLDLIRSGKGLSGLFRLGEREKCVDSSPERRWSPESVAKPPFARGKGCRRFLFLPEKFTGFRKGAGGSAINPWFRVLFFFSDRINRRQRSSRPPWTKVRGFCQGSAPGATHEELLVDQNIRSRS